MGVWFLFSVSKYKCFVSASLCKLSGVWGLLVFVELSGVGCVLVYEELSGVWCLLVYVELSGVWCFFLISGGSIICICIQVLLCKTAIAQPATFHCHFPHTSAE